MICRVNLLAIDMAQIWAEYFLVLKVQICDIVDYFNIGIVVIESIKYQLDMWSI